MAPVPRAVGPKGAFRVKTVKRPEVTVAKAATRAPAVGSKGASRDPSEAFKRLRQSRSSAIRKRLDASRREPSGVLEKFAEDIGLEEFYENYGIPVFGRIFSTAYNQIEREIKAAVPFRETDGPTFLPSPGTAISQGRRFVEPLFGTDVDPLRLREEGDDREESGMRPVVSFDPFEFGEDLGKAALGILKTKGWEPAKEELVPVMEKAASEAGRAASGGAAAVGKGASVLSQTLQNFDDFVDKEVPEYEIVKNWAARNAVEPVKDGVAGLFGYVTDQPVNQRLAAADEIDRSYIYLSNDITQRGSEREFLAGPAKRAKWIRMASGQYEHPAWEGYESPYTVEQLSAMSDYELVNAAYGTHTSVLASVYEAAGEDFKKISSLPAMFNVFDREIKNAQNREDYRGLGNMAEFLARQIANVVKDTSKASLWLVTGGQAGEYEGLVRALRAEPILTTLDAASTATLYGKGATATLKTGGGISMAGRAAARVPGATAAGGLIAGGARSAAAAPVVGRPVRGVARAGRGLRKIADVEQVEVRDPALAEVAQLPGVTIGADRVFRPTSSFFSKSAALLRKRLYEGTNPISRAVYRRGEKADARRQRAIVSAIVEQLGTDRAAPVVKAFTDIFNENPDVALRVMWDLSGADSFVVPRNIENIGGETVALTPASYADELQQVIDGRLWVNQADDVSFRFADESPGENWALVVADKATEAKARKAGTPTIKLTKIEVANLKANQMLMRRLAELPEDVVVRARERVEGPYIEQFGERIGRRLGGIDSPRGSLEDILQSQEIENIGMLGDLGARMDPRIVDLPPAAAVRLRRRLGIGEPTGISRRAEGLEAVARLQDLTIARLLPLVGDEFRASVEEVLQEIRSSYEWSEPKIRNAAERERAARQTVERLEREIENLQIALREIGEVEQEIVDYPPLSTIEVAEYWRQQVQAWQALMDAQTTAKVDTDFFPQAPLVVPEEVVFGTKEQGPLGSNKAGKTGVWRGSDGVLRYVKEYGDVDQIIAEFVANEIYRRLGAPVPETRLSFYVSGDAGSGLKSVTPVIVTKWIPNEGFELTPESARDVLRFVVADLWLANWDVAGLNLDNLISGPGGVVRIDQGGALHFRAQGAKKDVVDLTEVDLESLYSKNPSYREIIETAGYGSVEQIEDLDLQLRDIFDLNESLPSLIDDIARGVARQLADIDDDIVNPFRDLGWEKARKLLEVRANNLGDAISWEGGKAQLKKARQVLMNYMGSGYGTLNKMLRGLLPKKDDWLEEQVELLQVLIEAMPRTDRPLIVYRGVHAVDAETFANTPLYYEPGFLSTTFDPVIAKGFADDRYGTGSSFSDYDGKVVYEIFVPPGSKGVFAAAVRDMGQALEKLGEVTTVKSLAGEFGEMEFLFPNGTGFKTVDSAVDKNGRTVIRVVAITPGSQIVEDIPSFGSLLDDLKDATGVRMRQDLEAKKKALEEGQAEAEKYAGAEETLERMIEDKRLIEAAQKDIDFTVESLMRDALEAGETPTGARVFIPSIDGPKGAKKAVLPQQALAGRTRKRKLLDIYTGQFALLGDVEDLERFSGALARNLRIPFIAYESVTRLTDYLMRTGTVVKFSDDPEKFAKQIEDFADAGLINGNGELGSDYVILPVSDKTGFFEEASFQELNFSGVESISTAGRGDVGLDDASVATIIERALEQNAIDNLDNIPQGKTVVVVSKARYDALRKEMRAAAQAPGLLRRITRQWVRFTLTTLPRTPIANVVGSAFLSALGNGLGGYSESLRLIRRSSAPPELLSKGLAGMFDEGGDLVVAGGKGPLRLGQRYMNYMYYYNVMGEDLARLSVFVVAAKKGLKDKKARDQIDIEMRAAQELNDSFQELLEAVARGQFASGKPLTDELIRIRDNALRKADDFLGGARGLTSQQRLITTFIPFWVWYKHIFKLYFYTLPSNYPGRSLTMNAMARYGAEESKRQGFYDTFYEDGIKIGEEVRGPNVYSKSLSTNIFPFTFGGVFEAQEGAPGLGFVASNVAPVITSPLRVAGIGIPGQPLIGPEGRRVSDDFFSAERGEVALSEAERLFAPAGLAQRYLTPRGSLLLGAGRVATGREIPQAQPRGKGPAYAVTPRGFSGVDRKTAALEALARAFGITIERIPVSGPVARRRLREAEEREERRVLERYKEQRRNRNEKIREQQRESDLREQGG